jgi:hypothetical protein
LVRLGDRESTGETDFLAGCRLCRETIDGFEFTRCGESTISTVSAPAVLSAAGSAVLASTSSPSTRTVAGLSPIDLLARVADCSVWTSCGAHVDHDLPVRWTAHWSMTSAIPRIVVVVILKSPLTMPI